MPSISGTGPEVSPLALPPLSPQPHASAHARMNRREFTPWTIDGRGRAVTRATVRPVRPPAQRTLSACALVIVLAACRRGDATRAPAEAASESAGAQGLGAATGLSGQVVTAGDEGLAPALALRRAQGLAAMDAGRHDRAREAFAAVLDASPGNLATQALYDAATQAMLAEQSRASERLAGREATPLAAPPWDYALRRPAPIEPGPAPKLVLASESRDASRDDAQWLAHNGLSLPEYEVPNPMGGDPGNLPPTIAPTFGKFLLVQAIRQEGLAILFYGPDYAGGRFVAIQREDTAEIVALLDFEAYARPAGERQSGEQRATWAQLVGTVLLVSHGHVGPARRAGGPDGYITALDVGTGELLWRSAPRVAGAANFVVHGGHVFAGYGEADEPAYVHVLDATTGKTVGKTRLRGGPDYLFLRSGELLVRCDGTDYVFELQQGGANGREVLR